MTGDSEASTSYDTSQLGQNSGSSHTPLRFLIVTHAVSGGGAERVALNWASHVARTRHAVQLVVTNMLDGEPAQLGVPVVGLKSPARLWRFPAHVLQLSKLARGADVVVTAMPYWNLMALFAVVLTPTSKRPKVIISEHTLHGPILSARGWSFRFQCLLARYVYRRADLLVAPSAPVAAEMARAYHLPYSQLRIVPNGILREFPRRADVIASTDSRLNLIFVGRLIRQKNPDLVLETASRLAEHGTAVTVHFFGRGSLEPELRSQGVRLGVDVVMHGWEDDWTAAAPPCSVLLLPSKVEGFGNVLIEAAAAGIPGVAYTNALGVTAALVPHVTGILCDSLRPTDLAVAVTEAASLSPISAAAWFQDFTIEAAGASLVSLAESVRYA